MSKLENSLEAICANQRQEILHLRFLLAKEREKVIDECGMIAEKTEFSRLCSDHTEDDGPEIKYTYHGCAEIARAIYDLKLKDRK